MSTVEIPLAHKQSKLVTFHETDVKILEMHFSHNRNYLYRNNFESTFEKI